METGTTIAVIAGLVVGIGMIIVFAFILNHPVINIIEAPPSPTVWEPTYHVNLSILGMDDTYSIGEPITFIIRVNGNGYYCQTPNSAIWKASEAFASIPIWRSGLPGILCIEQDFEKNSTYHHINDEYPYGPDRSITITEPGKYVLGARIAGDPAVQKEFTVTR